MYTTKQPIETITLKQVWDKAMRTLTLRDHSIEELRYKLLQRFPVEDLVNQVVEKCIILKFLDDERFAKTYVRSLQTKGKSSYMIQQLLKQKQVDSSIIEQVTTSLEDIDIAKKLAEKKMNGLQHYSQQEQKKKITNFLKNKGFSIPIIIKILHYLAFEEDN